MAGWRQSSFCAQPATQKKREWQAILDQTRDVLFLVTPHAGSDLATWLDRLGKICNASAAIKDLRKNASVLRTLNEWYREKSQRLQVENHVFYETRKIKGVLVVEESSADPGTGIREGLAEASGCLGSFLIQNAREYGGEITVAFEHAERLLNQLLSISKMELIPQTQ